MDKRVKFDFEIDFSNEGGIQGQDFRLDIVGDEISDAELAKILIEDMRLLMVDKVRILNKEIISEKHKRKTLYEDRNVVERFWSAMNANDFRAAGEMLHDEYVLEWPQSGERIRGRANFVAVNENYPAVGPWRVTLNRLIAGEGGVASEVTVTDGATTGRAITFSQVREGKILRQVEYWPDPFEAAAWRSQWVERNG
jgi:ketosteroid isomerase-like protein